VNRSNAITTRTSKSGYTANSILLRRALNIELLMEQFTEGNIYSVELVCWIA
jgi:hypothetical protein